MGSSHGIETLFRDSFIGQVLYRVSGGKLCQSEFESSSYTIPDKYLTHWTNDAPSESASSQVKEPNGTVTEATEVITPPKDLPEGAPDGTILVDWDGPNDQSNPQQWPLPKKVVVAVVMAVCTASLYMGSALYTPAEGQLVGHFHTSEVKVTLGLSMFVWGYGIGSIWFSPMSENPVFGGRLYIYLFNQLVFACLQIPTALTNHIAPFAVLRFLAGLMAAPPLSTGGATYGDMFEFPSVVYAIILWSIGGIMGPFIGPLIGGALVQHNTWRWAFWFLLIMSGSVLGLMCLVFPETSHQAILMKKAHILRKRTGNPNILAPGDIRKRTQKTGEILKHIFWEPVKLTIQEPVLILIDVHLGLMYSVLYLYFEAIPIAYGGVYGFNLVKQGLTYLPLAIGCYVSAVLYVPYVRVRVINPLMSGKVPQVYHAFGDAATLAAILVPVGILLFGWTAHRSIHWVVSMVGNFLCGGAVFTMFQSYVAIIQNLYPPSQIASAFASSGVSRAVLAAAFPLFARPMYNTLAIDGFPVGWGCSLLAFLCMPLILLPIYIRMKGQKLHDRAVEKYGPH